jgi:hypothetical protein
MPKLQGTWFLSNTTTSEWGWIQVMGSTAMRLWQATLWLKTLSRNFVGILDFVNGFSLVLWSIFFFPNMKLNYWKHRKRCVLLLPFVDATVNLSCLLYVSACHWHACLSIPSVCILQKPWLPPHTAQTRCVLQAFILHEKHFCCTIPLCHHSFSSDSNDRVQEIPQSVIRASSLPCVLLHSLCRAGYRSNKGHHVDFLHQWHMSEWASLW